MMNRYEKAMEVRQQGGPDRNMGGTKEKKADDVDERC